MMELREKAEIPLLEGMRENVRLAPYTTLQIGGPARFFMDAETLDDITSALAWARHHSIPVLVLGGGSNMLISDEGFDGLVLHVALRGIKTTRDREFVTVEAAAGENWDGLVAFAVENDLGGIECLSGIPGLVGATPIQNVGAYGQDVSQTITEVQVLDRRTGVIQSLSNSECEFEYRQSRFKSREPDRYLVLGVTYRLFPQAKPCTLYPDVQRYLAEQEVSSPSLAEVRDAVMAVRRAKAMVIDPDEPESRSAGSFFTNPIIPQTELDPFLGRAKSAGQLEEGERVPTYPAGSQRVKLSAAWLIERAGFQKGFSYGKVGISKKHTLAIVNRGGGTAREVRELVAMIQSRVREKFGIDLVPEPNFIGF